jgi:hypothetical protein
MSKVLMAAFVIGVGAGSAAVSEEYVCVLSSWKGAANEDDKIAQSWTGESFVARMDPGATRAKVRRVLGNKTEKWLDVAVKSNPKFSTLIHNQKDFVNKGRPKVQTRIGFRIYKSGKCTVQVTAPRYRLLQAVGVWKE